MRAVSRVTSFALLAAAALLATTGPAIALQHGDYPFNEDWSYIEHATTDPNQAAALPGVPVDLPHTWNRFDPLDAEPGYRRDASWYRKSLPSLDAPAGSRVLLHFEAANMKADIFVNGERAGGHVGGYLGFTVDLTPYLETGAENELLVRVDNGIDRNLIPSQKSDFVLYGGLTRDVFLQVRPPRYVSRLRIDTPAVSATAARVTVTASLAGDSKPGGTLRFTSTDPDGATVAVTEQAVNGAEISAELPEFDTPVLWSPGRPALYGLRAELLDGDGEVVHALEDRFGLRWYEFGEDGAFYLNGERLLLRGTHRHEEHASYGAAMPNALHRRDMEAMKEVGANFVRLGHYPQDPAVYAAADELGLILWDELPWCRGGVGEAEWQANTEHMLRAMIAQNRNHPSVFFWSLGNEIYWLPDFEGGGDEDRINAYLQHLQDVAKELDPYRMTAIRKHYSGHDIVDVFSPSIWAGWYGGGYHQYEEAIAEAREKYPRMLHMEYGGSSHVGRFDSDPPGGDGLAGGQVSVTEMVNQSGVVSVAKGGDWSESYIVDLFDWHLGVSESFPGFAGNAQWAFKDFSTPLRPENPIPYVNQKGLVDRAGRPKEAYWVFRSYWTTDPAFCRIHGHGWDIRPVAEGEKHSVRAYCNTEAAELFVNGQSQGRRERDPETFPAGGLTWDVEPGTDPLLRLEVTGYTNGEAVARDALSVRLASRAPGKISDFRLSLETLEDGRIRITAEAVDGRGERVIDSRERVYFSHANEGSGGRLLTDLGTPDGSSVIELANGRAAILFEPDGSGAAVIEVRTQNHKGSYITLP